MSILQTTFSVAKRVDKILFMLINHDSDSKILDPIMITLRNPYTWIPLYACLLLYSVIKMKGKVFFFTFLSVLVVAITDLSCSDILKPFFHRLRPCYDPGLEGRIRILIDCGGNYSFPSNHAANHFGLAMFWFCYIRTVTGRKWQWLWLWALIIGYAQVYVGKHFPADILAGAVFGLLTGRLIFGIFKYICRHTPDFHEDHAPKDG